MMTTEYVSIKGLKRNMLAFILIAIFMFISTAHANSKHCENFNKQYFSSNTISYSEKLIHEHDHFLTSNRSAEDSTRQGTVSNDLGYGKREHEQGKNPNLVYKWQVFETMYIELYYPPTRRDLMYAASASWLKNSVVVKEGGC